MSCIEWFSTYSISVLINNLRPLGLNNSICKSAMVIREQGSAAGGPLRMGWGASIISCLRAPGMKLRHCVLVLVLVSGCVSWSWSCQDQDQDSKIKQASWTIKINREYNKHTITFTEKEYILLRLLFSRLLSISATLAPLERVFSLSVWYNYETKPC